MFDCLPSDGADHAPRVNLNALAVVADACHAMAVVRIRSAIVPHEPARRRTWIDPGVWKFDSEEQILEQPHGLHHLRHIGCLHGNPARNLRAVREAVRLVVVHRRDFVTPVVRRWIARNIPAHCGIVRLDLFLSGNENRAARIGRRKTFQMIGACNHAISH